MGWSNSNEDARADYLHDLAKHDPRPGEKDYVPRRLDVEMSTALDVAVLVKRIIDPRDAAKLIEQYANTKVAGAMLGQHAVPTLNTRQMRAVAVLISTCEMLCAADALGEKNEALLRERVAETLSAFNMSAANRDERVQA